MSFSEDVFLFSLSFVPRHYRFLRTTTGFHDRLKHFQSYPIPYYLVTTAKSFQRIPQEDLVVPRKLTGVGSRALSRVQTRRPSWQDARSGPAERYLPHASMHAMGERPQFSGRTYVIIRTKIYLSFQLLLLGDFLFPLVPADPGQRASQRSWTRTTRQLCRVQRPPTLFSATSPLSHLSKAPNPEKRPHLLCRLFLWPPK